MPVKKTTFSLILVALAASAQQMDPRAAYQQQQAVQEVHRLAQQFDQLDANMDQLSTRMSRLETGNSTDDLRAEISGIKAQIAELKRDQENMRREIVAEISQKMAGLLAKHQPPPPVASPSPSRGGSSASSKPSKPAPARPALDGPYYEHVVEPGQTLSLIASGYETTVAKIMAANPNIKPNLLRPGQKIIVPAEDKK